MADYTKRNLSEAALEKVAERIVEEGTPVLLPPGVVPLEQRHHEVLLALK
jgi:hypothetical protein